MSVIEHLCSSLLYTVGLFVLVFLLMLIIYIFIHQTGSKITKQTSTVI